MRGRDDRKQKHPRMINTRDQFAFSSFESPKIMPIISWPTLAPKLPHPSTIPETVPIWDSEVNWPLLAKSAHTGAQMMLEMPPTKNPRKKIKVKSIQFSISMMRKMWPTAAISNPKKETMIHFPQRRSDIKPRTKDPTIVPMSYIEAMRALRVVSNLR